MTKTRDDGPGTKKGRNNKRAAAKTGEPAKQRVRRSRALKPNPAKTVVIVNNTYNYHYGDHFMGSKNEVTGGNVVGMGDNNEIRDNVIVQSMAPVEFDMAELAKELSALRKAMKKHADPEKAEHDEAIGDIAKAETAAKAGDTSKVMEALKSAGKWSLEVGEKIGVGVATKVITSALGIGSA